MLDEHLDPLIDDVAREMTAAPPDAQFARRVSMRIAEAGESRRGWRRPWVLVPVACACALMLAVFVARENPAPYVERAFQARGSDAGTEPVEAPRARDPERVALRTTSRQTPRALPEAPLETFMPIE